MTTAISHLPDPQRIATGASTSALLVDDHPLFREALASLLQRAADDPLDIAHADTAEAALQVAASCPRIRLVIVDLHLPGTEGPEAIAALRRALPRATIIAISGTEARHEILATMHAGADAFISKAVPPALISSALQRALRGRLRIAELILREADSSDAAAPAVDGLTDRQRAVLRLVGKGHPNKEIALRMGLAEITIKQHVSRILAALGVSNRTQAAIIARRMALLEQDGETQAG
jgi:DNA-binding NarL/FixJ family response regulator